MLQQMERQYAAQPVNKALRNAIASNAIDNLTKNQEHAGALDTYFSIETKKQSIHDQKSSGRCWMFSGLNVLRANFAKRTDSLTVEYSQAYLFFYDQLEKSNLFLQGIIDTRKSPDDDRMVDWLFQNPLSDGGTFCGVADLVQKYGVCPKEAMPETYSSNNTSQIDMLLKWKLREMGLELHTMGRQSKPKVNDKVMAENLQRRKVEMLAEIYHILTLAYGVPPTEFSYTLRDSKDKVLNTKTYTPQSFYQEFWQGEDLYESNIMVMNDPLREYYKTYRIDFDRHTYDGHDWVYLNLPVDEIKPMAVASIKDSTAMYFSCDVAKYLNRKNGTLDLNNYDYAALLGTTFNMDKRQRVLTHASGSSHAMTLVAADVDTTATDALKVRKWMVENSWGESNGYKGHLIMTDEWFDNYMFRLVINKRYVEQKYLDMLQLKPVLLPAWDPMFLGEE
jgi:bleomycin hydrolase